MNLLLNILEIDLTESTKGISNGQPDEPSAEHIKGRRDRKHQGNILWTT